MKTPLVTGGSGFLGGYVVRHLLLQGAAVTALGRRPVAQCRFIQADLSSGVSLGDQRFDVVFHVGGLAHLVPRTEAERQAFHAVNVGGTRALLAAIDACKAPPAALVLVSTVAVYGADAGVDLSEETPRNAIDPYGASRVQAEDVALEWGMTRGVRVGVARLPLVVGRNAPGNFGAMARAISRGRYLGVGPGDARRSMVLARDVAAVLPRIGEVGGTFNLTDGDHPTFAQLEGALARALRCPLPHRLPIWVAQAGALVGDRIESMTGRSIPLNRRSLGKMTTTLTFSDRVARQSLQWNPSCVVDSLADMFDLSDRQ